MKWLKTIYALLCSKTLTVWLAGLFILYYLTVAVWSKEAFATFIVLLSSNILVRSLYIMFLINVILRIRGRIQSLRTDTYRLVFRVPLYAGIVVFLVSSFMSVNMRSSSWIIIGEGDTINPPWEKEQLMVTKIDPAIRKNLLRMDDSVLFDYEPIVTIMDRDRNLYKVGAFPPRKVSSTYMHILNFGLAPGIELRKGDELLSKGYMIQRIIPFGAIDSFEVEPFPYKFFLRILPNKVLRKGGETARNYVLDKPNYGIEIVKGDRKIFEGESDVSVSFDGDMTLSFSPPINWIRLEAVYDPFYLWFIIGLILAPFGLLVYPLSFVRWGRS